MTVIIYCILSKCKVLCHILYLELIIIHICSCRWLQFHFRWFLNLFFLNFLYLSHFSILQGFKKSNTAFLLRFLQNMIYKDNYLQSTYHPILRIIIEFPEGIITAIKIHLIRYIQLFKSSSIPAQVCFTIRRAKQLSSLSAIIRIYISWWTATF